MDFDSVLRQAQLNTLKKPDNIKYFKMSLSPPKKQKKPVGRLSDSAQTFVEKVKKKKEFEQKKNDKYILFLNKSIEIVDKSLTLLRRTNKLIFGPRNDNTSAIDNKLPSHDDLQPIIKETKDLLDEITKTFRAFGSQDTSCFEEKFTVMRMKRIENDLMTSLKMYMHYFPILRHFETEIYSDKFAEKLISPYLECFHDLFGNSEIEKLKSIIEILQNPVPSTKFDQEIILKKKKIESLIATRQQNKRIRLTETPKEVKKVEILQKPVASSSTIFTNLENKLIKNSPSHEI